MGHARAVWREDDRLRPLWDLLAEGRYDVSDFLLPRPTGTPDVYEELDALRATGPAFVRAQAAVYYPDMAEAPFLRPCLTEPQAACATLADAYAAWWEEAIAPYWPVMRRLVEDEVLVRARTFAIEGVDALFRFRASARLLVVGGAISYRALFNWTTPPMFIGTLLVGPLLQVFFFVFLGRELGVADDRFHLVGNAVLAASASCVYGGTMAFANERRYGTLGAVLLSPRARVPLWAGRALPYVLNGLVVSAFVLTVAATVLGLRVPAGALPGLGLVLLAGAGAGACSAFGLALGALGPRFRDVFLVSNVASSLLLLLTGAAVPRDTLPGWMRTAGELLPLTHAADAARRLTAGGGLDGRLLGAELLVGAGYALLAVALLALYERGSRRRATLDVM
ncbi:ABC transporter permease [Streptomyces sp. NPDC003943]